MRPNEEKQFEDLQKLLQEAYSVPAPAEQFANRLQNNSMTCSRRQVGVRNLVKD